MWLFTIAIALVLAACGGGDAGTSSSPAGEDATADPAESASASADATDDGETAVVTEEQIQIGASGSNSWLPIRIAAENGYFADAGLPNLQFVQIGSAPDAANALAAGEIQFAGLAFERAVLSTQQGRHVQCVMSIQDTPPSSVVVAADSGIEPGDWESLAGKTIGVVQGGWSEIVPKYLMQVAGLDVDSVQWTSTPNTGAMLSALQGGQIDGFSGIEPAQRQAIAEGYAEMFFDLEDPENLEEFWPDPFQATCLQAQAEYASANPEVVAAVREAIVRALGEIHSDPSIAVDFAADAAPDVDRSVWEESIAALEVTWSEDGELSEEAIANVQELLVDFGILEEALPYEEAVFTGS
ncbi:ABC transporter substrate-binding protein [Microbacterium sp.]|uniref:ABC transporter substrate-binding protein n=1 Tax=Microbacterium sp. TaxID=51671 RepID=UPI0031FE81A0|nr:ABC transporter substrate-binding protein [Microbacterium sp.]